jgi:endogenous inhibitor of DNA gyrase (YacG/DUF329 family)
MLKICIVCKKSFEKKPSDSKKYFLERKKYCSHKCAKVDLKKVLLLKGELSGKRVIKKCLYCQKEYRDFASDHRKYCSQKCAKIHKGLNQTGDQHWNWQGGMTPKINQRCNAPWWKELRKRVYERDNWTCQKCGIKCSNKNNDPTKIQCDHIIKERDGGSHNMSNLQTLCLKCHIEKDWKHYYG